MNQSKEELEAPTRLLGRIPPEASSSPDREVFPQAYNIGAFHDSLHQWDKAIEYYKLALRLSPGEPLILKKLGISYYKLKMYDESLPVLERCEKDLKNDPEVYKYLGSLYTTLNASKAKAIEYWTRFLELQKNDPEAKVIKESLDKLKEKRLK
jgi:tetratricopeptide (TPR) repeat protein